MRLPFPSSFGNSHVFAGQFDPAPTVVPLPFVSLSEIRLCARLNRPNHLYVPQVHAYLDGLIWKGSCPVGP
jgi:hypothetical protein